MTFNLRLNTVVRRVLKIFRALKVVVSPFFRIFVGVNMNR